MTSSPQNAHIQVLEVTQHHVDGLGVWVQGSASDDQWWVGPDVELLQGDAAGHDTEAGHYARWQAGHHGES